MASDEWIGQSLAQLSNLTAESYGEDTRPVAQARWNLQLQAGNPLWQKLRAQPFEAQAEGGKAHVIALIDERLPKLGLLGFFGSTSEAAAVKVLEDACGWLKSRGMERAYGPINGTITYDYRFNLDSDYKIPGEPVNPAWYVDAWRRAGFRPFNKYVSGINHFPALFNRLFIQDPHPDDVTLRAADSDNPGRDLNDYHELMNAIFPQQSLYCPVITFDERSFNMNGGRGAFDPNYSYFLETDGWAIGMIVAHPHNGQLVIKTLGVLPEARGRHLSGMLIHRVQDQADADGLKGAVYSTIRVGNAIYRMKRPGVRVYRRYVSLSRVL